MLATIFSNVHADPVQNSYRISAGEVIEVKFSSLPELNTTTVVQENGSVILPEAGTVQVAGLSLPELQSRMQVVLSSQLFHLRTSDGKQFTAALNPEEINTSVISFLPVYVTGDVLSPGEQPYRHMLTVQQAIAVAGGLSRIQLPTSGPTASVNAVQPISEAVWLDYAKQYFVLARIRAELGGSSSMELSQPVQSPVSQVLLAELARNEAELLKTRMENRAREKEHLKATIIAAEEQLVTLIQREKIEAEAEREDQRDLEKVSVLYKKGEQTNSRLAELRRALLLSSARRLETLVELLKVRNQRADLGRQVEKLESTTKAALLEELRDATIQASALASKITQSGVRIDTQQILAKSVSTKVFQPKLLIVRTTTDGTRSLIAANEDGVLPGDVVVVSVEGN
jgi:polysaccharide biosynthesis/export protein